MLIKETMNLTLLSCQTLIPHRDGRKVSLCVPLPNQVVSPKQAKFLSHLSHARAKPGISRQKPSFSLYFPF